MAKRGENIYKRKDGRYEGRYVKGRSENGHTQFGYIYGYQYAEVRNKLLIKKAELLQNSGTGQRMTLEAWMANWLEGEVQSRVKRSSYLTYTNLWRRHVRPALGGMLLDRISADEIRGMLAGLNAAGLSPATQRGALRLVRSALTSAQEEGHIRHNPCSRIRLCTPESAEQRVLNTREQERLRTACTAPGHTATLLGLYTGLRLGEVCALQWADVDWERKTITVRRTVQRMKQANGAGTALSIGSPKTARSRRVIPVPDFLLGHLQAMRADSAGPWIFAQGRAAEPRTVQRRLLALTKQLGMEDVHFHTLRHTFATRLVEMGVDVKTVSVLLGHSSTRTTLDFYTHSHLEQQRMAVNRLALQ